METDRTRAWGQEGENAGSHRGAWVALNILSFISGTRSTSAHMLSMSGAQTCQGLDHGYKVHQNILSEKTFLMA